MHNATRPNTYEYRCIDYPQPSHILHQELGVDDARAQLGSRYPRGAHRVPEGRNLLGDVRVDVRVRRRVHGVDERRDDEIPPGRGSGEPMCGLDCLRQRG